ncbi:hypothetical protein PoB_004227800 [Plakobranchus ocellatus]|uniref:Uncharacterized protein n=1 Tax=Plakobranchus ocellatus TaxID=259542 RepID=A0AAV4B837_9GAST|nr:hypothetical protein PoB_004227800 [Plakobranchus ocellatus]
MQQVGWRVGLLVHYTRQRYSAGCSKTGGELDYWYITQGKGKVQDAASRVEIWTTGTLHKAKVRCRMQQVEWRFGLLVHFTRQREGVKIADCDSLTDDDGDGDGNDDDDDDDDDDDEDDEDEDDEDEDHDDDDDDD